MLAQELGLGWNDLAVVVIAGVGIYGTVLALTRLTGARSLSSFSSFDYVVTVAVGAVVGRVVLVRTSLLAGVAALAVLFGLQALVSLSQRSHWGAWIDPRPLLLVRDGRLVPANLRRARLSRESLLEQLRLHDVVAMEDVSAAVLERSGAVSVLTGPVDDQLLEDENGAGGTATGA